MCMRTKKLLELPDAATIEKLNQTACNIRDLKKELKIKEERKLHTHTHLCNVLNSDVDITARGDADRQEAAQSGLL